MATLPSPATSAALAQPGDAQAACGANSAPDFDPHERLAVGLARLGEVLGRAGEICQELAEIELAAAPVSSVMSHVRETEKQPLLSASKVAARMGCTTSTIRRWRRSKLMPPAIVIGGVVRWEEGAIDRWIAERREQAR